MRIAKLLVISWILVCSVQFSIGSSGNLLFGFDNNSDTGNLEAALILKLRLDSKDFCSGGMIIADQDLLSYVRRYTSQNPSQDVKVYCILDATSDYEPLQNFFRSIKSITSDVCDCPSA